MYLSEYFARQGHEVMLSEKEDNFMQRASYVNQARVHNGYHYPRSILTALRSRVSLPKFYEEFRDCIDDTFDKYYLISNIQSKISAHQFENFCSRIGAVCEPAPHKITSLVDPHYVEAVFTTKEFVFNAEKLMQKMLDRIGDAGVQYHLNQKVQSVREVNGKLLIQAYSLIDEIELEPIEVDEVFNCTYSMINQVINDSGLDMIPLKHELTEMALVKVPEVLSHSPAIIYSSKGVHFKIDGRSMHERFPELKNFILEKYTKEQCKYEYCIRYL
ncbi:D amino acid oxidase (DAO) family [Bathymodiolus heckerae thiotrophic gill symbiont]|nr:D amino acid oxidase (DAO) family [Bathymodiolus heckerae thiotrophic gill symbiont]